MRLPDYRGDVTGLDGIGDHAFLEDILASNPGFDPPLEDPLNTEAARRLELAGAIIEWTWENWLGVEAERGV